MCEAFLKEAQSDPAGELGKSDRLRGESDARDEPDEDLQRDRSPASRSRSRRAFTMRRRIAKEFRDGKRPERIAVSVDMLSTGYNCRDLLNIGLMRPIFSPTEYIQIKGRGTRRYTFKVGNTEYEKKHFFLLDFCGVAEYFEEKYDYTVPLKLPRARARAETHHAARRGGGESRNGRRNDGRRHRHRRRRPAPGRSRCGKAHDIVVSREVRIVGPNGEKVDVMTFRGSFERDVKEFAETDTDMQAAVEARGRRRGRDAHERALLPQAGDVLLAGQADPLVRRAGADAGLRLQRRRQEAAADEERRSSPTRSTRSPRASTSATTSRSGSTRRPNSSPTIRRRLQTVRGGRHDALHRTASSTGSAASPALGAVRGARPGVRSACASRLLVRQASLRLMPR